MSTLRAYALRGLRARSTRSLLNVAGVAFGVALVVSVLLLSHTLVGSFNDLYDAIYGKTDLVVSGRQSRGVMPARTLGRVRAVDGVASARGTISAALPLVRAGKVGTSQSTKLNAIGIPRGTLGFTDARLVSGTAAVGHEVVLEEAFARAHGIRPGARLSVAAPSGPVRLRVAGLFHVAFGSTSGAPGLAFMPIAPARRMFDRPHGFDEIDVVVSHGAAVGAVSSRLRKVLGPRVRVDTPRTKSGEVSSRLRAVNALLYLFAGMALVASGFMTLNAFSISLLERTRELGLLRAVGGSRATLIRIVLWEAGLVGVGGAVVGLGAGVGLALGLIALVRAVNVPIGGLEFTAAAPIVATATALFTTTAGALLPAYRAARSSPMQAASPLSQGRIRPSGRRTGAGVAISGAGAAALLSLASASSITPVDAAVAAAGLVLMVTGAISIAPAVTAPLVRFLAHPLRAIAPLEATLAVDAAARNPLRAGATASALVVSIATVACFGTLGSSFLRSVTDELDSRFKADFTIQPVGFQPGIDDRDTIPPRLESRVRDTPGVGVTAGERLFLQPRALGGSSALMLGFDPRVYPRVDGVRFSAGGNRAQVFRRVAGGGLILGTALAHRKRLGVGKSVTLAGAHGRRRARIAGTVDTAIFAGATIGMSKATMAAIYGAEGDSQLTVKLAPGAPAGVVHRRLKALLRSQPQLTLLSNQAVKSRLEHQQTQQLSIFYLMFAVAIGVGVLGVANTVLMNVIQRTREIGILRALGAQARQIRRSIVAETLLSAGAGVALGLAVGAWMGWLLVLGLQPSVPGLSYHPPVATAVAAALGSVVIGALAGGVPARRAMRIDVIRAVSYE